jgi:hypothetical protein
MAMSLSCLPKGKLRSSLPEMLRCPSPNQQIIPDTMDALAALKVLRNADVLMALVHDEYGHFEGLFIPEDCKLRFRKKTTQAKPLGCSIIPLMRSLDVAAI